LDFDYSDAVGLPSSLESRSFVRACPLQWLPVLMAVVGMPSPPQSPLLGRALPATTSATGPCVLDLNTSCVCSSNFAAVGSCAATSTTNGQYSDDESCKVTFAQRVLLQVHLFNTESGYDELTVDPSTGGTVYSGTGGPDGVEASALSWASDGSAKRAGFKVCFTPPSPSPPLSPPSPPTPPSPPLSPPSPPLHPGSRYADSSSDLIAALGNSALSRIVLKEGTYEFDDDMCSNEGGSALCIDRDVTIEAKVSGSVVLKAKGARRVIYVSNTGRTELVGLNITEGKADDEYVSSLASIEPSSIASMELDLALAARRAVASMLKEWLTLKAAISMTTPLISCVCILNFP
jgi:hypothetical protein